MTIIGIKGRPRSGKTAIGVKMLAQYRKFGYCPVSNVEVDFKKLNDDIESPWQKSVPLSIKDINKALDEGTTINELYQANNVCIYISEMMQYAFSRKSGSNTNAMIAYMLSQLGKTNTTFIHDEQLEHTVDLILRELNEYVISSFKLKYAGEYNGKIYNNCIKGFYYQIEDKNMPFMNQQEPKPLEMFWPIENAIKYLSIYESNNPYRSEVLQLKLTQPAGHTVNNNNQTTKQPSKLVF